ncbi:MAG: hypothetical protein WBF09_05055 [Candidatus Acidiferrum sp.]
MRHRIILRSFWSGEAKEKAKSTHLFNDDFNLVRRWRYTVLCRYWVSMTSKIGVFKLTSVQLLFESIRALFRFETNFGALSEHRLRFIYVTIMKVEKPKCLVVAGFLDESEFSISVQILNDAFHLKPPGPLGAGKREGRHETMSCLATANRRGAHSASNLRFKNRRTSGKTGRVPLIGDVRR